MRSFPVPLIDVLLEGALNSPIVKAKAPNMVKKNFTEANEMIGYGVEH